MAPGESGLAGLLLRRWMLPGEGISAGGRLLPAAAALPCRKAACSGTRSRSAARFSGLLRTVRVTFFPAVRLTSAPEVLALARLICALAGVAALDRPSQERREGVRRFLAVRRIAAVSGFGPCVWTTQSQDDTDLLCNVL